MSKVILATVGTSAITNYLKEKSDYVNNYEQEIEGQPIRDDLPKSYLALKTAVLQNTDLPVNTDMLTDEQKNLLSAEVVTIETMLGDSGIDIDKATPIYLFYTDTLDGLLAAEINADILRKRKHSSVTFVKMQGVNATKEGMKLLQNETFFQGLFVNYINGKKPLIVFSGGYKAFIPTLSIYCRDNQYPMFYKYEDTDEILSYEFTKEIDGNTAVKVKSVESPMSLAGR